MGRSNLDEAKSLLDQLFGKDRDLPDHLRTSHRKKFNDPDVCKFFLCGLCPFQLFKNTKADLGTCPYSEHEERFKIEYDKLSDSEKLSYGYERELLRKLQDIVRENDRVIEKNKRRAEEENAPRPLTAEQQAQLDAMTAQIKAAVEASEKLGEEGKVDASMAAAADAERIKEERDRLEKGIKHPMRLMYVCEISGLFINSTDNQQRTEEHFAGKTFLGYKVIRERLKELQEKYMGPGGSVGAVSLPRPDERPPRRDRSRSPPRPPGPGGDRDRDRDRPPHGGYGGERPRGGDRRYDDRDRGRGGGGYEDRGRYGGDDRGYGGGRDRRY